MMSRAFFYGIKKYKFFQYRRSKNEKSCDIKVEGAGKASYSPITNFLLF